MEFFIKCRFFDGYRYYVVENDQCNLSTSLFIDPFDAVKAHLAAGFCLSQISNLATYVHL